MKATLIASALATFALSIALNAQAGENVRNTKSAYTDRQIDTALMMARRDTLLAPIKSSADLAHYWAATPKRDNPIGALSTGAQRRFLSSLVFTGNGLGGYNKADLESELSATQAYRILSLFGVQRTTPMLAGARILNETDRSIMDSNFAEQLPPTDYSDYKCSARATCSLSVNDICTSNC